LAGPQDRPIDHVGYPAKISLRISLQDNMQDIFIGYVGYKVIFRISQDSKQDIMQDIFTGYLIRICIDI